MGNQEQGRVRTGGDAEEERVGGRGHVLPEEGEPQNHLLDAEKGTVEGEWRQYEYAFVGVAEELCGRT